MLGGMSWESTAEYYRLANEMIRDRLGGMHSARLVLCSVDFAEIERLQVSGGWHDAGRLLATEAARLEAAGAEMLLLCTNTMHRVADDIQAAVPSRYSIWPTSPPRPSTRAALTASGCWRPRSPWSRPSTEIG